MLDPRGTSVSMVGVNTEILAQKLLAWYDRHRRTLPWRAAAGKIASPYHVWLSEIMLQQTTVATVSGRFDEFIQRWPRLEDLAAASLDDVLHAWQGLGYYARARNLHACARQVIEDHDGRFPRDEAALRTLRGIGDYTAAAIAAIAFDQPATIVDGNVERVIARLHALETPLPQAKKEIRQLAKPITPELRPGDYAQAIMDLGATVCTPRKPGCLVCPWQTECRAYAKGNAETLPRKAPKRPRPHHYGVAFWALRADGAVLLRRRPEQGLLGGMMEVPSTAWRATKWTVDEALDDAPGYGDWQVLPGEVSHVFTHFKLTLQIVASRVVGDPDGVWSAQGDFSSYALPTLMKKVVRHALDHADAVLD